MNMFKKNGGFTLVELIVVIAILAILAAVAIPAYSGYISKAQEANDMTLLDSVKTAVVFACTEKNASVTLDKIVVTVSGSGASATYTVTATDYGADGVAGGTDANADTVYSNATGSANLIDISTYVPGGITFESGKTTATLDLTAATPKWVLTGAAS